MAEADGSRIAYEMLIDDPVQELMLGTEDERREAKWQFDERSRLDGGIAGFYRLALSYLGDLAFVLAKADSEDPSQKGHDRLFVPFCPYGDHVPDEHDGEYFAYGYLFWIEQCNIMHPPLAKRWMEAILNRTGWSRRELDKLEATWKRSFDRHVSWRMKTHGLPRDQAQRLFCVGFLDDDDGGGDPQSADCPSAQNSRQALKLGNAKLAAAQREVDPTAGAAKLEEARACWRTAIRLWPADQANQVPEGAEPPSPQSPMRAKQLLDMYTLSCKYNHLSLAAISRDYRARQGDLIRMSVIQQALRSLGHYDGPLHGQLDPPMRAAIAKFQRDMGFDETDMLSPFETTMLVCNAAQKAGDVASQNALGVMFATNLGVEQNIDSALEWLRKASTRGDPNATFNLAVLYGSGIILNSYRLCDAPRSPEQAQQYLEEAAAQGHVIAAELMRLYGPGSKYASLTPRERWKLIEMQQLEQSVKDKTGIYAKMANVGTRCAPDRSIIR